jgi:SAM-dependent methyltransferase
LTAQLDFERLIAEAAAHQLEGWDFTWIRGRWNRVETPWDCRAIVNEALAHSHAALDLDTGGGEFLASFAPLPGLTVATEAYQPNIAIARDRLKSLGARLVACDPSQLPLQAESFDLVLNRHGSLDAGEIQRILMPGGRFITQQVGPSNFSELNDYFGRELSDFDNAFEVVCDRFRSAGLILEVAERAFIPSAFHDIGAVAFYLAAVPWQIPGFDFHSDPTRMRALHDRITAEGAFPVTAERYHIEARRPA